MKKYTVLFLMIGLIASCVPKQTTFIISDCEALEALFSEPQQNIRVILEPGEYHLTPEYFLDQTCGNCQDPNEAISATKGMTISGKNVSIIGPSDRSAVIHTHAGYGIFIKDLQNGVLENLTITGTIRDTAQMATNAAIVVSNSDIVIRNNTIRDNLGDSLLISKHISGVMGICGRENSHIQIIGNQILRNSWDGIAFWDAGKGVPRACISNNVVYNVGSCGISITLDHVEYQSRNQMKRPSPAA